MSEHRVFISYSHRDLDDAWRNNFANALRDQNVMVWVDEFDLNLGDNWIEKMETALRESDAIIAVISGSRGDPNLYFELGVAVASGKHMILVVDPSITVSFPFDLRNQQQITMQAPEETARNVARAITAAD
jgi:hypothetical protein